MGAPGTGLALDVGIGTGYVTRSVLGGQRTVCVDLQLANLAHYRSRTAVPGGPTSFFVVADATRLPFRSGVFERALLGEVLEHLEDDAAAVGELARVLAPGGHLVITVPYTGLGFTSFLALLRIPTVHDQPGPEYHARPGYDEATLTRLLETHGLIVERVAFVMRLFTRLATDLVSLAHLVYQRLVHHRRSWTWAEAARSETGLAFRVYRRCFPLLCVLTALDRLLPGRRGFGLAVLARKP